MTHRDPIGQAHDRGSEGAPEKRCSCGTFSHSRGIHAPDCALVVNAERNPERKERPLTVEELDELQRDHLWDDETCDRLIADCREAIELREQVSATQARWEKTQKARLVAEMSLRGAQSRIAELEAVNCALEATHRAAQVSCELFDEQTARAQAAETRVAELERLARSAVAKLGWYERGLAEISALEAALPAVETTDARIQRGTFEGREVTALVLELRAARKLAADKTTGLAEYKRQAEAKLVDVTVQRDRLESVLTDSMRIEDFNAGIELREKRLAQVTKERDDARKELVDRTGELFALQGDLRVAKQDFVNACRSGDEQRDRAEAAEAAGPPLTSTEDQSGEWMSTCSGCQSDADEPHTWKECHAVVSADWGRQHAELVAAEKRAHALDVRRSEMRMLLTRLVKYVRSYAAGKTTLKRLARLTDQVADYLQRTSEPRDVLRGAGGDAASEPDAERERLRGQVATLRGHLECMVNLQYSACDPGVISCIECGVEEDQHGTWLHESDCPVGQAEKVLAATAPAAERAPSPCKPDLDIGQDKATDEEIFRERDANLFYARHEAKAGRPIECGYSEEPDLFDPEAPRASKCPLTVEELDEVLLEACTTTGLPLDRVKALIAGCREAIELREKLWAAAKGWAEAADDRDFFDNERVKVVEELTAAQSRIAELERLARDMVAAYDPYSVPSECDGTIAMQKLAAALPAVETTGGEGGK